MGHHSREYVLPGDKGRIIIAAAGRPAVLNWFVRKHRYADARDSRNVNVIWTVTDSDTLETLAGGNYPHSVKFSNMWATLKNDWRFWNSEDDVYGDSYNLHSPIKRITRNKHYEMLCEISRDRLHKIVKKHKKLKERKCNENQVRR